MLVHTDIKSKISERLNFINTLNYCFLNTALFIFSLGYGQDWMFIISISNY